MISSENMVVLITTGDPFSCLLFSQTESMKRCQTCGWQCTQIELQYRREREREREKVFISGLVVTRACSQEQMIQTGQKKSDNWRLCRLRNSSPHWVLGPYISLSRLNPTRICLFCSQLASALAGPCLLSTASKHFPIVQNFSAECGVLLATNY